MAIKFFTMKKLLIALAFFASAYSANACSCMSTGSHFCESFQNDTFVTLVGLFKKIDTIAYGFKVERLYTFYGTETRDTLTVWGDNGALCRLYDGWQIGDSIVLSLQVCDTAGNQFENPDYPLDLEKTTDYQVSGCGFYSLEVEGGRMRGYIDQPFEQTRSLSTFAADNCLERLTTGVPGTKAPVLKIYPQPVSELLTIELDNTGNIPYTLTDMQGRVCVSAHMQGRVSVLATHSLANGTYLLSLQLPQGNLQKKVVVVR
jgi:hypothetical protein